MSETRIPQALALLREKGWCKGTYHDDVGRHCILGALAVTAVREVSGDLLAVMGVVEEQTGSLSGVAYFNDHPDTTFADVERVLEKAILERGGFRCELHPL